MDDLQLTPLRSRGCYFYFCNKQEQNHRVYLRIDWAMGNYQWLQGYGAVEADYLLPGVSDYSPIILQCKPLINTEPKPFMIFNTVIQHQQFSRIITSTWAQRYTGTKMFQLA